MFGVNKLLWLGNHAPREFECVHHWLSIEDFVLWKLSRSFATDYSIASRTMLFDQRTLAWSESLLQVLYPGHRPASVRNHRDWRHYASRAFVTDQGGSNRLIN